MHHYLEDSAGMLGEDLVNQHVNQHHFRAPTLYHPATGILSSPSILPHPSYLANNQVQQIPPYNPPSSPVAPAAYTFGVQAFQGPSASDLSTRLEGLQQRHFQAPTTTHSRFQTSRTINGPKKRQRDGSDDEEGEEAVSRLRACGPLSEMDIEEDETDRDYKQLDFVREESRQRPTDHEE